MARGNTAPSLRRGGQERCFASLADCHAPSDTGNQIRMGFPPHLRVAGGFFVVLSTLEQD